MTQDDESAALAHEQELEQQQTATLFAAFVRAQAQIDNVTKEKVNPHFRSKYADLGAVVDAIRPALAQNGLAFYQRFHESERSVKVETIIVHQSGEQMSCGILSIPVTKLDAQGFGSAVTYARRYALQAAFGVAPEDDDGNAAAKVDQRKEPPDQQKAKQEITDERLDKAIESIKAGKYDTVQLHNKFTLTPEQQARLEQSLTQETA